MYNSSKQLHFFFSVGSDASTHPSSLSFSKKKERLVFYHHRHRTLNVQKNILPLQIVLITFSCVSRIRRPPFLINKAFFFFFHTLLGLSRLFPGGVKAQVLGFRIDG